MLLAACLATAQLPVYGQPGGGVRDTAGAAYQPAAPHLLSSFERIVNTSTARLDAMGSAEALGGLLYFSQQWRGRTIFSGIASNRDDESLTLSYERPLWESVSVVFKSSTQYSADSRIQGINNLLISNGMAGVRGMVGGNTSADVLFGYEYNEQSSIPDRGYSVQMSVRNDDFVVDEFRGSGYGRYDITSLQGDRRNSTLDAYATLTSNLGNGGDAVSLSVRYQDIGRGIYSILTEGTGNIPLEKRDEERIQSVLTAIFRVSDNITSFSSAEVNKAAIARSYNRAVDAIPLTAVSRTFDELRLRAEVGLEGRWEQLRSRWSISFDSRDEVNTVANTLSLAEVQFASLQRSESNRNNSSTRTGIVSQSEYSLGGGDYLSLNASSYLLRYDTPSMFNDDDRDELQLSATARYVSVLSPLLRFSVSAEYLHRHLVYLRSTRSSQNNVNRVLRLSPSVEIRSGGFAMRPTFEVLANYTAFDYEQRIPTLQSFSLRQAGYSDSLVIPLSGSLSVECAVVARYFERSAFRWSDFSERPQDKNAEIFARTLVVHTFSGGTSWGVGMRWYSLNRQGAAGSPVQPFYRRTVAPEASISAVVGSTKVMCNGWYEITTGTMGSTMFIPNFVLSVITLL